VIFNYLQKEQIKKIVDLELAKVEKRLATKEIKIEISEKAKELLVKEGFDQNLGARPLKRIIQKTNFRSVVCKKLLPVRFLKGAGFLLTKKTEK